MGPRSSLCGPPRTLSPPLPAPLSDAALEFTAACCSCPHYCYSVYSKKVSLPCGTQRNCTSHPPCPNSTILHVKSDDRPHRERVGRACRRRSPCPARGIRRLRRPRPQLPGLSSPDVQVARCGCTQRIATLHPQSFCLQPTSRNQHVMTAALLSSDRAALGLGVAGQVFGCASRTEQLPRAHVSVPSSRRWGGRGSGLRDRGFLCGRGKGALCRVQVCGVAAPEPSEGGRRSGRLLGAADPSSNVPSVPP